MGLQDAADVQLAESVRTAGGPPRRLTVAVLLVIVAVLVAWAHLPALSATTVWFDDESYVTHNPKVLNPSWETAKEFLAAVQFPTSVAGYYQPLTMISLMLDSAAGGRPDHMLPFHRTNLILHVLNSVLVVVLLILLFDEPFTAAVVGLAFGVHPLTVEPVTWMGERKTLLATFFALAALVAYVRYAQTARGARQAASRSPTLRIGSWYAAIVACYLLALLCKPTSTPLPLLFLVLDFWPLHRLRWRALTEKIPLFALGLLSAGVTLLSQQSDMAVGRFLYEHIYGMAPNDAQSTQEMILSVVHNIAFYPAAMLWPSHLLAFYLPPYPMSLANPLLVRSAIAACVLFLVALVSLRWTRALLTGWLFFLVALFPATGIVRFTNTIASEKFAYLPSVGFLIVLGWAFARCWAYARTRGSAVQVALCAVLLLIVAAEARATRRYAHIWHDDESLYGYVLSHSPQAWWVQADFADVLANQNRMDEAVTHYVAALEGEPDDVDIVDIRQNLGNALFSLGRAGEAVPHYEKVLARQPTNTAVMNNLGLAFLDLGRLDDADAMFHKVLDRNPDDPTASDGLARVMAQRGQPGQAVAYYRTAAEARPDAADAHSTLADALQAQGDFDAAIKEYRIALQLEPNNASIHNNLGAALTERGRFDEAIAEFRTALQLSPDLQEVQVNLREAQSRRDGAAH
jgi:tetratricopeptide (TPR) repeat protein